MKGVKKCCGLLLVSLITLGLSLSVSSDVNALKHSYSSLYIPGYTVFQNTQPDSPRVSLSGGYWTEYPQSNSLSQPIPKSQRIKSVGSPCYQSSESIPFMSSTTNTYRWRYDFSFNIGLSNPFALPSGSFDCHAINATSWYEYTSISIQKSSGSHSTPAAISDLFGSYSILSGSSVKYMYAFNLPLTFNSSVVGAMTQGRTYEFHGSFSSGSKFYASDISGNSLSDIDLHHPYVLLNFNGVDSNFNVYRSTYSFEDSSSNRTTNYCTNLYSSVDSKRLYFDCYFTSPADIVYSTFSVTFQNYSQYENNYSQLRLKPIWFNDGDYVFFGDFYVITDGDSTEGDDASIKNSGTNILGAPGAEATMGDSYDSALSNLFNFNFINPFSPIFNLFTDSSQCANIPIIAGMLGSTETTYCPWFSSTTRSILTPVLGLSATMLVFGFLVRWLSSSSGNMFEDQTTHKWGNTQLKQGGK